MIFHMEVYTVELLMKVSIQKLRMQIWLACKVGTKIPVKAETCGGAHAEFQLLH